MFYITSPLQCLIILFCASEISANNFKIDIFELFVFNESNPNPIEKYDLKKVKSLSLGPNYRFNFNCSASGSYPELYVVIFRKEKYERVVSIINTTTIATHYKIETVNCVDSGAYTCRVGNRKGTEEVATNIVIECPTKEARFESNTKDHYVAVPKDQKGITLICDESESSYSLSLFNQKNRSHRLNYTEHSNIISYYMADVKCEDMGTYVCVVERSNLHRISNTSTPLHNLSEKTLDVSVNNCPPRVYDDTLEKHITGSELAENISITLCISVSINTRLFGVFYKNDWVTNGTCKNGICLETNVQNDSRFQYHLKVIFTNIETNLQDKIFIKIGSGYNFKSNYIEYTIYWNNLTFKSTTKYSDARISFSNTSIPLQAEIASKLKKEPQMVITSKWNTVLFFLCIFLLGSTMALAVAVHYYRSKGQRFKRRPSRISQRLQFLTRNRHSPRIAENPIPNIHKMCDNKTSNGVCENTSQQNLYVNNGVKTFYIEPEPPNNIYNNVHPIDYGRYMNEDGLVYVAVHNSEPVIPPKAIYGNPQRKVSYTEIDLERSLKLPTTSSDTTAEEGDDIVYHNINGVF